MSLTATYLNSKSKCVAFKEDAQNAPDVVTELILLRGCTLRKLNSSPRKRETGTTRRTEVSVFSRLPNSACCQNEEFDRRLQFLSIIRGDAKKTSRHGCKRLSSSIDDGCFHESLNSRPSRQDIKTGARGAEGCPSSCAPPTHIIRGVTTA